MECIKISLNFDNNFQIRASAFIALIFYYLTVIIMSVNGLAKLIQPQINGVLPDILGNLKVFFLNNFSYLFFYQKAWIIILGVPLVALTPDVILNVLKRIIRPNPADQVLKLQLEGVPIRRKNLPKL